MDFFFNDLYPNQGVVNTRTQTVPEAEDRQALTEEGKQTVNAKITPKSQRGIWIGLIAIVVIGVVLGASK